MLASIVLFASIPSHSFAQDETDAPAETEATPAATTTADPEVPVDQLALLVKPLTAEELEVEAVAWRDLVKAKVSEISQSEIAAKQVNNKSAESEEQKTESETEAENKESDGTQNDEPLQKKTEYLSTAAELREQRTALVDRLDVVLNEWEKKGGDVESFRKYVIAVSGLNVDVSDASATWVAVKGWLISKEGGQRWLWNIAKFLLILFAFWILARIVGRVADHVVSRWGNTTMLMREFIKKTIRKIVVTIGAVVAVSALEVDVTPLLAAIGAAGLVVGLALQGTLSNFASGLLILAYRPFDTGDVVEAGGISGKVESMNLLSTHIKTFDNKHVIVPNNDIWSGVITNATISTTRRVDMIFGIGYDDDLDKAEAILTRIVTEHPLTLSDPEPTIKLNELADSSVNFICRPWSKTSDYWTVYWDVLRSVKNEFDREGISIPYPQRDIHVHQHSESTDSD